MGMNSQDDEEISEINMTPLVDVMLVLLIIFIITVPVITHSVKVDLPQASNLPTEVKPKVITVSVQKNGDLLWNDEPMQLTEMEQRFKTTAVQSKETEVRIQGDKSVAYEEVIKVMAAAQRAGIQKLGFITEPQ